MPIACHSSSTLLEQMNIDTLSAQPAFISSVPEMPSQIRHPWFRSGGGRIRQKRSSFFRPPWSTPAQLSLPCPPVTPPRQGDGGGGGECLSSPGCPLNRSSDHSLSPMTIPLPGSAQSGCHTFRVLWYPCSHPVPLGPTRPHPVPCGPTRSHPVPTGPTRSQPVPLGPIRSHPFPPGLQEASPPAGGTVLAGLVYCSVQW